MTLTFTGDTFCILGLPLGKEKGMVRGNVGKGTSTGVILCLHGGKYDSASPLQQYRRI